MRTESTRLSRHRLPELVDPIFVGLLALGVLLVFAPRYSPFTTDSDAYLDIARNILAGEGFVQRIVDFWRPGMPDPLGYWPPMYSLLTAFTSLAGIPLDLAARVVTMTSYVIFMLAFHHLARQNLARRPALAAVVLAGLTPGLVQAGVMIWSEMLFLALSTLAIAGLMEITRRLDSKTTPPSGSLLVTAIISGLFASLAIMTRYHGVILLPFGLLILFYFRAPWRTSLAWSLAPVLAPVAWVVYVRSEGVLGRTIEPIQWDSMVHFAKEIISVMRWVLLPWPLNSHAVVASISLLVFAIALAVCLKKGAGLRVAPAYALVYLISLIFAGAVGMYPEAFLRYLVPISPFLWLSVVGAVSTARLGPRTRKWAGVLAVLLILTTSFNLFRMAQALPIPPRPQILREAEFEDLQALVPPGETPVLSNVGHLLRSATGRSVIQVGDAPYRTHPFNAQDETRWREAGVKVAVFQLESPERSKTQLSPEERYGEYLATRLGYVQGPAWTSIDSVGSFVLYQIP